MLTTIVKTKNNENNLYDCLESVQKSDEIIVVDEYSNDDTIKIAKDYKAKIVYSNKNELSQILNQTVSDAQNDWILFIYDNEIVSKELLSNILNYIKKPKKNKNAMTVPFKLFYLNREIKSARKNKELRVFLKDACVFKDDNSTDIVLNKGKIYKFNRWFNQKKGFISSYKKNSIETIKEIAENNSIKIKNIESFKASVFIKPILKFLYFYFIKSAIFDGKAGYIYSLQKAFDCFLLECSALEREKDDIQQSS